MVSGVRGGRADAEIFSQRPLSQCLEAVKMYRAQGHRAWVEKRTVSDWEQVTIKETDTEPTLITGLPPHVVSAILWDSLDHVHLNGSCRKNRFGPRCTDEA